MRYISRNYVEQMLDDNENLDLPKFAKKTAREAVTAYANNIDKTRFEESPDQYEGMLKLSLTFEKSIADYHKWIAEQSDETLEAYVLPVHGIDDLIP